ncbi:MAG: 3-deoxy-D-manno-octulosonic acid transferase [Planctomycetota bacterium]|jgi:3-deoxy-D-manno-octulosonic-acid transferase
MAPPPDAGAGMLAGLVRRPFVPPRLQRWLMDAAYGALTVILTPYALVRVLRDHKTRSRWRAYARDMPTRFGRRRTRGATGPCVWVHGVSVGEVKAAGRLVDLMEEAVPGLESVISVTTDTGRRVAEERYPGRRIDFYPPDLSWIARGALEAVRPDLILLVESEFWPNFLSLARERGTPVVLVNGKISQGSANRFRFAGPLARPILDALTEVCVQMDAYAERFLSLGIDPSRLHVTGNMKFDNIPLQSAAAPAGEFRDLLGLGDGCPLVTAGSTHPGEERALARIHGRLAAEGLAARLVVAPRHPARADVVEGQLRRDGRNVVRRSRLDGSRTPSRDDVILLDTVGELETVYGLSDAVFVGGTLVPHGGQNMMEPASLARPVVVGPHVQNFRGEVQMLLHAGGLALVEDEAGVEATLRSWLQDPDRARDVGRRARDAIRGSKGATERTMEVLRPILERVAAGYR